MRKPRIYIDAMLSEGGSARLEDEQARYLRQVLRLDAGAELILFNGRGGEYSARVERVTRDRVEARVGAFTAVERESALQISLVQGLSRGERMDYTVQKAVELGVYAIVPVITERSVVKLDSRRAARRLEHWRGIVVNACQQCGRTRLPQIHEIISLDAWIDADAAYHDHARLVLSANATLGPEGLEPMSRAVLLIGPEGGLSEAELERVMKSGFKALRLGPRILRTETAAVSALTALQMIAGDLSAGR